MLYLKETIFSLCIFFYHVRCDVIIVCKGNLHLQITLQLHFIVIQSLSPHHHLHLGKYKIYVLWIIKVLSSLVSAYVNSMWNCWKYYYSLSEQKGRSQYEYTLDNLLKICHGSVEQFYHPSKFHCVCTQIALQCYKCIWDINIYIVNNACFLSRKLKCWRFTVPVSKSHVGVHLAEADQHQAVLML